MKRVVELSLAAGRRQMSPDTGFIHDGDKIPLYDNFCFVLGLLRAQRAEYLVEAKTLLEKLLPFEVEGNFPVYLHDYPHCCDTQFMHKLEPILYWLLKNFSTLLGEELKQKLRRLQTNSSPLPLLEELKTPAEWADYLMRVQMLAESEQIALVQKAAEKWHAHLLAFKGMQPHRAKEPEPSLFDLFMGELYGSFPKRALTEARFHMRASLVFPFAFQPEIKEELPYILDLDRGVFLAWGDSDQLHTLVSFNPVERAGDQLIFTLPKEIPEEKNSEEELTFYLNVHPEHTLLVNGRRATAFRMGDTVQILSKEVKITLRFEAEGSFVGFFAQGNRPHQPKLSLFEAHDWKIGLRTLRRTPDCRIKLSLQIE